MKHVTTVGRRAGWPDITVGMPDEEDRTVAKDDNEGREEPAASWGGDEAEGAGTALPSRMMTTAAGRLPKTGRGTPRRGQGVRLLGRAVTVEKRMGHGASTRLVPEEPATTAVDVLAALNERVARGEAARAFTARGGWGARAMEDDGAPWALGRGLVWRQSVATRHGSSEGGDARWISDRGPGRRDGPGTRGRSLMKGAWEARRASRYEDAVESGPADDGLEASQSGTGC